MTDERQAQDPPIPLPAGTLYTAGIEDTVQWPSGYLHLCFWAGFAPDGTRRLLGISRNCAVDPRTNLPGVDIYLIHANPTCRD